MLDISAIKLKSEIPKTQHVSKTQVENMNTVLQ